MCELGWGEGSGESGVEKREVRVEWRRERGRVERSEERKEERVRESELPSTTSTATFISGVEGVSAKLGRTVLPSSENLSFRYYKLSEAVLSRRALAAVTRD